MADRRDDDWDEADLERRLRDNLRAHADALPVDDRPFAREPADWSLGDDVVIVLRDDDGRDGGAVVHTLTPADRPSPRAGASAAAAARRHGWLAVATAAVIALVVAGLTVGRGERGDLGTDVEVTTPTTAPGTPPAGTYLVPTWVPPAWELVELSAKRDVDLAGELEMVVGGPPSQARQLQLLERADGARILLEVNHSGGDGPRPERVGTVRGHPAQVWPTASDGASRFSWDDGGTRVLVTVRGVDVAEAVAVADSLGLTAGSDVRKGFTSVSADGWTLRTEALPSLTVVKTHAVYVPAGSTTDGNGVQVWAEPARGADANLFTEAMGTRLSDDTIRVVTRGYTLEVTVLWRDGTRVRVVGGDDEAISERIARSVGEVGTADLDRLAGEASARMRARPAVAAITTARGRLEMKAKVGALRTFCVTLTSGAGGCGSSEVQDAADVFVGDERFVVAAAQVGRPPQFVERDAGPAATWPHRIDTGQDGTWWLSFSPAPPERRAVTVELAGGGSDPFPWPLPGRR